MESAAHPASYQRRLRAAAAIAVGLLLVFLFHRNAWVSDDAYITFRSVEQLVAGHGPRWNPHERVQAFTHPLWLALLAVTRVASPDLFWNSLALSLVLTAAAVFAVRALPGIGLASWLVTTALLTSSKAFVDFAWSGLETPLTYLLLAWFLHTYLRVPARAPQRSSSRWVPEVASLTLAAGLLTLNHPDLVLIVAPALAWTVWTSWPAGRMAVLRSLAAGASPLVAWTVFATVYYGSVVPNTAYAKLNTGIPGHELWVQGLRYVGHTAVWDPVTIVVCLAAIPAIVCGGPWRLLGLGAAAYGVYVLKIGGDFMVGRLFAPAFFVFAPYVASALRTRHDRVLAVLLLVAVNLVVPHMPLRVAEDYDVTASLDYTTTHGIVDEKSVYYADRSLRRRLAGHAPRAALRDGDPIVDGAIGLLGYSAGLDRIIVDGHALADPLLARLPATRPWRPGHFWREIPDGYLESVRVGVNHVRNPQLRRLYEDVRTVTQGPFFSSARWRAIARLHFGTARPQCIDPPCRELRVERLALDEYQPRATIGGGRVLWVDRRGVELRIGGRLMVPVEARNQVITLVTTEAARSSELATPAAPRLEEPVSSDFVVTVQFATPREARRAARSACLIAESLRSRAMLLDSANEICSSLLLDDRRASLAERGSGAGRAAVLVDDRHDDESERHQPQDEQVVPRLDPGIGDREPEPVQREKPERQREQQEEPVPGVPPEAQEEEAGNRGRHP